MTQYPPIISAFVTMMLTFILSLNKQGMMQDIPNDRSLHTEPIPRVGGVAIMAGILSGWVLLFHYWAWWIVVPTMGLFGMSLIDDVHGLSAKVRLIGHFAAALILVAGAGISWTWWVPVIIVAIWMTNLFNFMDGSDGLAGGMALFGFTFYGIAALIHGNEAFAMMNFTIGAAAMGFLYHNFDPAKVFMGDAGSIPLGFLTAAFGVWGWQQGYWPFWYPMLIFSPFVIDATATLLKRTWDKKNIVEAHREHYYQRLILMGWTHRKTAVVEYLLMLLAGGTALWGLRQNMHMQLNLLAGWGAIYLGLASWVDRHWRKHQAKNISESEV